MGASHPLHIDRRAGMWAYQPVAWLQGCKQGIHQLDRSCCPSDWVVSEVRQVYGPGNSIRTRGTFHASFGGHILVMEGASAGLQAPWRCLQILGTSAMPQADDCLPLPGSRATGNGPGSLTGSSGEMENVPGRQLE